MYNSLSGPMGKLSVYKGYQRTKASNMCFKPAQMLHDSDDDFIRMYSCKHTVFSVSRCYINLSYLFYTFCGG